MKARLLAVAIIVASQLGVIFPTDVALALLQNSNPSVRAPACACVRAGYEVVATLIAMLDDPDDEVSIAAACALGRMGRAEAQIRLKRYLTERPSSRVIEAVAEVADDDAIVLLARLGRARPDLAVPIISALEEIDNPRATSAASALIRVRHGTTLTYENSTVEPNGSVPKPGAADRRGSNSDQRRQAGEG